MASKTHFLFLLLFIFSVSNIIYSQDRSKKVKDTTALNEVVLTASLITTNLLEAPTAASFVNAKKIHETTPQLSLKEYLGQVPGLFAQNQYNYNQDLRISIRGFGARAAFGIRGVFLNIDGISETTPDGQGQLDNIPISILSNVEILRGPSSALYGNAAGGVILMHTLEDLGPNKLKFRAMVSEIARLNSDAVIADLDAAIPQVAIGKSQDVKVKVEQRRRVVPIVFGKEYLRQHLPKAIKHCSETTESNMSKRISTKMRSATGNKTLSAHCLRHTLKALSDSVDANQSHVAAIGGWSGGSSVISAAMQQYGAAGLSSSKGFKAVHDTSRKILACVLDVLEAEHGDNVINIAR